MIISKKLLLVCAAVCTLTANRVNAQAFVSEDFNSVSNPGLPAGWTSSSPGTQWATGVPNTILPNVTIMTIFSLNKPEHMKAVGIDGSQASADGAMLASPTVSIPASATNLILEYDVAFFYTGDSTHGEGLVFTISTDGGASWWDADFVAGLVNPQNSTWDTRIISMSAYAGESNLKFGFRYTNQGGNIIGAAFDNIRLVNGADGTVITAFAGDHPDPSTGIGYQLSGSNTTLTGTIKNVGSLPISSYYIKYKTGNGPVQSSPLISTPVASMSTANFPAGLTVTIPANGLYSIHAWVEAAGDVDHANDTAIAQTVGVPQIPLKRPVFEEGTGTWCGWCPRGNVFMDHFASTHPNGVAAQIAVHNSDPMTVSVYNDYMANYTMGFPNIVIDRTIVKDPQTIDSAFTIAQNNFGFADFTVGTPVINGNTVSVPVIIKPVVDIANPKLALVVTESNVSGSGNDWPQHNYYSGLGVTMGGWENEALYVDDVNFHFVARSITSVPGGSGLNLPSTLIAGTTYNATLTTTLNSNWKSNDLQYTALFINGNNTSIMNSAFTALPVLSPALPNTAALADLESGIEQVVLYPNPASDVSCLAVNIKDAGHATLTVSDITGEKVFSSTQQMQAGNNAVEIETRHLAAGYYLVNLTTEKTHVAVKLQVIK